MTLDELTRFLGWCLVYNIGIIAFFFGGITLFKNAASRVNAKLFGVSEETAQNTLFKLFYQYRLLVAFFNLVPWLVLYFMF